VHPDKIGRTPFSYSIGFFRSFRSPEILVFNMATEKAHAFLSVCAEVLEDGGELKVKVLDERIMAGGYKVVFRPLRPEHYGEYVGTALRFYDGEPFPAWVMFLPDAAGLYPWEDGYDYVDAKEAMSVV
jgi:hypothetical protein